MQPIHVLFGSESNNSADLADRTAEALQKAGLPVVVVDMASIDATKLPELHTVLVITSTYGNGNPPSNAEALYGQLMGTDIPLAGVRFSVCGLGDTTYDRFAQCGKDFDARLGELGGTRIAPRQDCDVDYEEPWQAWLDEVLAALAGLVADSGMSTTPSIAPPAVAPITAAPGTRRNPVVARLLRTRPLGGVGSTKETLHVELSLEGSGLVYEPGDSLGIFATHDPALVDDVLIASRCDGGAQVTLTGAVHEASGSAGKVTLREALSRRLDLAHVDPRLLQATGAALTGDEPYHVIDVLLAAKEHLPPQRLADCLRPLAPRAYSIASSPRAHPGEVHLTVDVIRYVLRGRQRGGVASTQLADRARPGATFAVYLHGAPHFRLAADDVPIIMIGPGTGVAPFRAFLEERRARGASGQSWLFFGARNAGGDFFYGDEFEAMRASGALTRLDCAFSRDQPERVYVQHRMREHAAELYAWIERGAVVYVCGDAHKMAPDVNAALVDILAGQGKTSREDAAARLAKMTDEGRHRKDVY